MNIMYTRNWKIRFQLKKSVLKYQGFMGVNSLTLKAGGPVLEVGHGVPVITAIIIKNIFLLSSWLYF